MPHNLEEVGFEACVRRENGGVITHDKVADSKKFDNQTTKLSKTTNEDFIRTSLIKIEVENKRSISPIVNTQTDMIMYESGDDNFDPKQLLEETQNPILNFPPPIEMKTILSGRSKSGRNNHDVETGVLSKTSGRQPFSP